jgi:hypothetical protein
MIRRIILTMATITLLSPLPCLAFIPSTLFNVQIKPHVSFLKSKRLFSYSYRLISGANSQQNISSFGVSYALLDLTDLSTPVGW